jgi:hypothetical protein
MKKNRITRGRYLNRVPGHVFGATWLGLPTPFVQARVCRVVVGDSTEAKYWARDLVGQERWAVQVRIVTPDIDETFYLDNEDGSALECLVKRSGDPQGTRQVLIQREVGHPDIKPAYGRLTR